MMRYLVGVGGYVVYFGWVMPWMMSARSNVLCTLGVLIAVGLFAGPLGWLATKER